MFMLCACLFLVMFYLSCSILQYYRVHYLCSWTKIKVYFSKSAKTAKIAILNVDSIAPRTQSSQRIAVRARIVSTPLVSSYGHVISDVISAAVERRLAASGRTTSTGWCGTIPTRRSCLLWRSIYMVVGGVRLCSWSPWVIGLLETTDCAWNIVLSIIDWYVKRRIATESSRKQQYFTVRLKIYHDAYFLCVIGPITIHCHAISASGY